MIRRAKPKSPDEAAWREEFEREGEVPTRRRLGVGFYSEPGKAAFGYRWLDERDEVRFSSEVWVERYAQWTFWAAVVAVATVTAVAAGIAGIFVVRYFA